ncbi:MAG: zinc ribbon domain-containing protein [Planctomycetaceae bacterium]|jgi:hypothetical protein|nr:zinc ribbon domain-containing protein [Planctomycetaceae bacterium]
MFCPTCGNNLPANVAFCSQCGNAASPTQSPPHPQTSPQTPPSVNPDNTQKKNESSILGKALRFAAVIFIAYLIAVGAKWTGCSKRERFLGIPLPSSWSEYETQKFVELGVQAIEESSKELSKSPESVIAEAIMHGLNVFYGDKRIKFTSIVGWKSPYGDGNIMTRKDAVISLNASVFFQNEELTENLVEELTGETVNFKNKYKTFEFLTNFARNLQDVKIKSGNMQLAYSAKAAKALPKNYQFDIIIVEEKNTGKQHYHLVLGKISDENATKTTENE